MMINNENVSTTTTQYCFVASLFTTSHPWSTDRIMKLFFLHFSSSIVNNKVNVYLFLKVYNR